jgi:hypothetical protein
MKKHLAAGLVMLGLAALPVSAGELGLLVDKQVGQSQVVATAMGNRSYDAVSPTGVGFRGAFSVLDLKVAELGVALTYHPKAEGDLKVGGQKVAKLGNEYVALGVQADWKFLVNVSAGVDLRREKLTTSGSLDGQDGSTTYTRPWVRAGLGFSFPTPVVSPFVRLEVAVPVSKESKTAPGDDFRKAMAPSLQVALYGGIRF